MRAKREKRHSNSSSRNPPSQNNTSQPSQPPQPPPSPPARIYPSSTLSLRQQLKLIQPTDIDPCTKPRERTSFRRRKSPISRLASQNRQDDSYRKLPHGKFSIRQDPICFIDGYNVIGAWPKLRKLKNRMDMDGARLALLRHVEEFAHVRAWNCVLVFDAQRNSGGLRNEQLASGVELVYTGAETADSYIERQVFQHCEQGKRQVWAATSDSAQSTFSAAKGAHIMSATLFIQELKRAKNDTTERVAAQQDEGTGARAKMLLANLDQQTRHKLYALRDKLDANANSQSSDNKI